MPNWVTNIITIQTDNIKTIQEIRDFVHGKEKTIEEGKTIQEDNLFDFDKIIPMPKEYKEEAAIGMKLFHMQEKDPQLEQKRAEFRVELQEKYGFASWYEWSINHWGTKWNSEGASEFENGFELRTAWGCPTPIFLALSKKFPEISFKIEYADEDIGYNCGSFVVKDDKIIADYSPVEGTSEADRMSCQINGYDYDEYLEDCKEGVFAE